MNEPLAEQRARWARGDCVRVETLLGEYPALRGDADALLDVIYQEVFLREQRGESPAREEYLHRFPHLAAAIGALFDVHQAILSATDAPSGLPALYSPATNESFALVKEITIVGRSSECDLALTGRSVSRRHCRIVRTAGQVVVEDMGSSRGLRVNGARVTRAPLCDGDRLEIGGEVFKVLIE
jgi:pSer/pThr/pTyr-binding forkhead associated (FHA) protein